MILIRLFQLAEMRDRVAGKPRPIAIFLDELKYHISKPAMEGLGAARDKGVHMLLAHQSVADLKDCPADLNGDAVVGAVVENTKFKLVYRLQDPDTAEWVSKMSGTILVDDETRYVESSKTLNEVVDDKRNIRMAERQYVDTNMLLNLPDFVSYIFTTNDVPKPSLIAPIKVQKQSLVTFDETQAHTASDDEKVEEHNEAPASKKRQDIGEENNIEVETASLSETETLDTNEEFDLDAVTLLPPNKNPTEAIQSQKEIEAAVKTLERQIEGLKK
ncbi:hypothetical protein THF1C08_1040005 [Vibrio jasicida]|uniref:TraD/TraG TraM recognition site domain-containing protein n=2 Tax=Vibrio jasicida TaxID=766224 RepID=A0AAU9QH11_9VIBR|nr:hypothetical protein THF1C08_1040005 [Vibrio jasicida]CAH1570298.1 hypothetical protein THF1A12_1090005 [Vibrio jasicida]